MDGHLKPLFIPLWRDWAMGVVEHPSTDGRMFAFEGKLIGAQSYLVELPNNSFNLTPCMTMPDVGHVCSLLAANPQLSTVGPFAEDAANTLSFRMQFASSWRTREDSPRAITSTPSSS